MFLRHGFIRIFEPFVRRDGTQYIPYILGGILEKTVFFNIFQILLFYEI